jgi:hypothetical protein
MFEVIAARDTSIRTLDSSANIFSCLDLQRKELWEEFDKAEAVWAALNAVYTSWPLMASKKHGMAGIHACHAVRGARILLANT